MSPSRQIAMPVQWLLRASPVMRDNFLLGAESDAAIARKKAQEAVDQWIEQEAFLLMVHSLIEERRDRNGR